MTLEARAYLAYGLAIRSPLVLPAPAIPPGTQADAVVRRAKLACSSEAATGRGVAVRATAEGVYLCCEAGTFLVRDGAEVIVDAAPGVPDSVLRLYLVGPALAILLRQRGHLVLHASAVAIDGEAVAFLGGSGRGKSTTAGALHARGHGVLADDVVAVTAPGPGHLVVPGFPQLKLWPDASWALGADPRRLPRVHPDLEKRDLRVVHGWSRSPVPLGRIYTLDVGSGTGIEDLAPQAALVELLRHSYGGRSLQSVQPSEHFLRCASLVRSVPVRRLKTWRSLAALADTAELVESDRAIAAG